MFTPDNTLHSGTPWKIGWMSLAHFLKPLGFFLKIKLNNFPHSISSPTKKTSYPGPLINTLFQTYLNFIISSLVQAFFNVPLRFANSRYPSFLHFRTQSFFPRCPAKFHRITIPRTQVFFFWTFISEKLRPPLIFLVSSLGWEFDDIIFWKIPHGLKL